MSSASDNDGEAAAEEVAEGENEEVGVVTGDEDTDGEDGGDDSGALEGVDFSWKWKENQERKYLDGGNAEDVCFVTSDECTKSVYDFGRVERSRERLHPFCNVLSLWTKALQHCVYRVFVGFFCDF